MRTAVLLCLLMALPGPASASEIEDPLPLRDPYPFRLLFLDQAPAGAAVQPPGRARFSFGVSYVNTMVATDRLVRLYSRDKGYDGIVTLPVLQMIAGSEASGTAYVLDAETLRSTIAATLGIARRLEVRIEVPFLSQGHGFMDGTIDGFHAHFHLPDGGRPSFARDNYRVAYLGDGATVYLDRPAPGLRWGDIVLAATGALLEDKGSLPGVSLTLAAKLPTGDYRLFDGSGSRDLGAALRLSKRSGRSSVHAGFHYNAIGEWRLAPTVPLRNSRSLYISYAFSIRRDTSLIAQVLRASSPFRFRSGNDLGRVAMEVTAGFRRRLRRGLALEWSFIENLDPYYNTPDIGTFLGFTCEAGRSASPPAPSRGGGPND